MGDQRDYENPNPRQGIEPKLMVTGRLRGTCDGRPVEIEAVGPVFHLHVPDFKSAWTLRSSVSFTTQPLLNLLQRAGVRLRLRIGAVVALDVLPTPHLALRLFSPSLRSLRRGAGS